MLFGYFKKSMLFFFFFIYFLGGKYSYSQQSIQKFIGKVPADRMKSAIFTLDSCVAITGQTQSFKFGCSVIFLTKINLAGEVLWTREYGKFEGAQYGMSIQQNENGEYIIAAEFDDSAFSNYLNICLLKTDSIGKLLWSKKYSDGYKNSGPKLQITNDNGLMLAFNTRFQPEQNLSWGIMIVKTDNMGNILWSKIYSRYDGINLKSIVKSFDNYFFLTGEAADTITGGSVSFILKIDSVGNNVLFKMFNNISGGNFINRMDDSTYLISGQAYFLSISNSGTVNYCKSIITPGYVIEPRYISYNSSKKRYLFSGTCVIPTSNDWYMSMVCFDSFFNPIASKYFGGGDFEMGYWGYSLDNSYNVVLGGTNSFGNGDDDIYFVLTDSTGNSDCLTHDFNLTLNSINITEKNGWLYLTNKNFTVLDSALEENTVTFLEWGCDSFAGTKDIYPDFKSGAIQISPNPINDNFFITADGNLINNGDNIVITNILGETVWSEEITRSRLKINSNNFLNGIYFISISKNNIVKLSCKVVIIN